MRKICRLRQRIIIRKRLMENVHNSVNNDSASDSVNIELPTINSSAANSTYVFEPIIENPLSLSVSSHKVEGLEVTLISKPGLYGYCIINVAVLVSVFSSSVSRKWLFYSLIR